MQTCPQCGGGIGRSKKSQTATVGGSTFIVKLPAYACRDCKAVFMEGSALERADLEIACVLASRGPATGEAFRFIRKTVGMRAVVVASLLGVTAETISRWENGQRPVDGNAWIAMGSIALERAGRPCSTLKRLMGLSKGAKLPKTVRIDVTNGSLETVPHIAPHASSGSRIRRSPRTVRAAS
jgi:DNA-binding transcriptional regulator YiaG